MFKRLTYPPNEQSPVQIRTRLCVAVAAKPLARAYILAWIARLRPLNSLSILL
jgi:hypothetical protein